MLRIRPFRDSDSGKILSWCHDEIAFYKWTAGVLGEYPLTPEQFGAVKDRMAFTAVEDDEPVGFFILRNPDGDVSVIRIGFVIVSPEKRGKGYGKSMLQLAIRYGFDIWGAEKITLGVFANNLPAYHCYRSMGFRESPEVREVYFPTLGTKWQCIELEIVR